MAVAIILNIVLVGFVVVGMLALLGRAIVKDAQANGETSLPSLGRLRLRPSPREAQTQWRAKLDPAVR